MTPTALVPITRIDEENRKYQAQQFTYNIVFNGLTGAWGQATGQIQIQADSAFVVLEQTFSFWKNTDVVLTPQTIEIPDISVLLTNTGSGRQLSNRPVRLQEMYGDGRLPFVLPSPQFFSPSAALQVQITSTKTFAAGTYNLSLSYIGEKRFYL